MRNRGAKGHPIALLKAMSDRLLKLFLSDVPAGA